MKKTHTKKTKSEPAWVSNLRELQAMEQLKDMAEVAQRRQFLAEVLYDQQTPEKTEHKRMLQMAGAQVAAGVIMQSWLKKRGYDHLASQFPKGGSDEN